MLYFSVISIGKSSNPFVCSVRNHDGYVESVSIGDENNFKKGDSFPDDAKVVIVFRSIKKVATPIGSKEAKEMDFNEIYNLFSEKGFIYIEITEKEKKNKKGRRKQ